MGSRTNFVVERTPMAGPSQIVAVVAAGGALGFLVWKMRSAAPPPPPTDPCAGLTGDALAACKAAGILVDIGGAVAGQLSDWAGPDDLHNYDVERDRRRDNNNTLNGAPAKAPLSGDVTNGQHGPYDFANWGEANTTPEGPYRYANGCEPYYGAPGWSKCAPGTLDMYEMAVEQGIDTSSWRSFGSEGKKLNEARAAVWSVFETPADLDAATSRNDGNHPTEKLNKDHYGTAASGDPLTQGPWSDSGQIWWLVRGQRFTAPEGQVPLAIAMRARGPRVAGQTQADVDAKIIALTDAQAVSLIPVGSYGAGGGTGTTTTYSGCAAIIADPTLTWNPVNSNWERLRAGAKRNLGPCGSGHASTNTSGHTKANTTSDLGDHFGLSFGLSIGAP